MESDDYKQIYISHLNPYKISVKLSKYDAQIFASIKEIKGAYFSKPFWIVCRRFGHLENKVRTIQRVESCRDIRYS